MRPMRCVLLNQGIGPDPYFMWLALDSHHLPDAPEANGVLIFPPPPHPSVLHFAGIIKTA